MDIKSYFSILKGNLWIILTTLFITVGVTTAITLVTTPIYLASTTLRIATSASGSVGYSDYMYADRLMNTYTRLATSRPVLQELTANLNLKYTPPVKVETVPNTELIKVSVESDNPLIAQNSANSLAEILIKQGRELYSGGGKSAQDILGEQLTQAEEELNQARKDYDTYVAGNPKDTVRIAAMNDGIQLKEKTYATLLDQYDQARLREMMRANNISVVEPAILPTSPSKPNKVMNIGLGFLVGLAGGIGLAFFFESLGSRLYSSKKIEEVAGFNIIGKIPEMHRRGLFNLWKKEEEIMSSVFKESFRRLYAQLLMQNPLGFDQNACGKLLITSSEPGEGKSTIVANLAKAIAQNGKKVIVVDCDLHIPKQHIINGLSNTVGLSSVLCEQSTLEEAVQPTRHSGMFVLAAGPIPPNPAKILGSLEMRSLVVSLNQYYDVVLLDTPALLALADASLLLPIADGVIYVARRNFIREEAVVEACRQLTDNHARVMGLVVNDAELNGSHYYYHR